MLNVTRLLVGTPAAGDSIRYGERPAGPDGIRALHPHDRPVVVWNITRRCNLACAHCYSASTSRPAPDELTTQEARAVLEDLAEFRVPVVLLSGGEPLLRPDVVELVAQACSLGVQPVLSTNGTLLTDEMIDRLRQAGLRRIGISLDGLAETHDRVRGVAGAFEGTTTGLERSIAAGFRVSLRLTMARYNADQLEEIFGLAVRAGVQRLCIYHLAYAGRGRALLPFDLGHDERRAAVASVFRRTVEVAARGYDLEVLTVDNHADGAYLLLWAAEHAPQRVEEARRLLSANGGNSSGLGIACIDERGRVHPDQFWRTKTVGDVRRRPFSAIWQDGSHALLDRLRARRSLLPDECRACRFLPVCNGNLRVRAEAASGDPWGMDPACYLTAAERAA